MRSIVAIVAILLLGTHVSGRQQNTSPQPIPPRAQAPFDITGTWVSVVTEDWRWRMVTPAKGDTVSIPVNAAGQKAADAWDYAKDIAAGNQCKAYGAGAIMRMPTRLRISWPDDRTLKIETDAGTQTRLLHFGATRAVPAPRSLQGYSIAEWADVVARGRGRAAGDAAGGRGASAAFGMGGLKVVTTSLREGYLRKNGIPYSQDAVVTEYLDRVPGPDGAQWLIVRATVDDPTYLAQPYITSAHFMLEPDASKFRPTPCDVDPPLTPPVPERR